MLNSFYFLKTSLKRVAGNFTVTWIFHAVNLGGHVRWNDCNLQCTKQEWHTGLRQLVSMCSTSLQGNIFSSPSFLSADWNREWTWSGLVTCSALGRETLGTELREYIKYFFRCFIQWCYPGLVESFFLAVFHHLLTCLFCRPYSESQGKHFSPVWQVRWVDRDQGSGEERDEILISISADGRVTKWSIRKGFESTGKPFIGENMGRISPGKPGKSWNFIVAFHPLKRILVMENSYWNEFLMKRCGLTWTRFLLMVERHSFYILLTTRIKRNFDLELALHWGVFHFLEKYLYFCKPNLRLKWSHICCERKHDKKIYCHSECSYYCTQVDTDPGKNLKSWNFLWHSPGLESPGKRVLFLESSGNLLNSSEKYDMYGRQCWRRINIGILKVKGAMSILESWKNQSETWKSPGNLFLKVRTL